MTIPKLYEHISVQFTYFSTRTYLFNIRALECEYFVDKTLNNIVHKIQIIQIHIITQITDIIQYTYSTLYH